MRKAAALAGSALFFIVAPAMVAGFVPLWIARRAAETFHPGPVMKVAGGVLIAAGAAVLIDSFTRFALKGLGTPAPVFPTQHLVVTGLYRYVRNPMYVGVLTVIVGQAIVHGTVLLLAYAAVAWLMFHLFVVGYEEPALRSTYGPEYERFCANVRRWIPRLRPWK